MEGLRSQLEREGYKELKVIPERGICGIYSFIFTTAIVYGLDEIDYTGRYCYPKEKIKQLVLAYAIWDGKKDPIGEWVKHKGYKEYSNPNLIEEWKNE